MPSNKHLPPSGQVPTTWVLAMQILTERTRWKVSAVMPPARPVYFPSSRALDPVTKNVTLVLITGASKNGLGAETALIIAPAKPKQMLLAGRDESKITPLS